LLAIIAQNGKEMADVLDLTRPTIGGAAFDLTLIFQSFTNPKPQNTKIQCKNCMEYFTVRINNRFALKNTKNAFPPLSPPN